MFKDIGVKEEVRHSSNGAGIFGQQGSMEKLVTGSILISLKCEAESERPILTYPYYKDTTSALFVVK